MINYKWRLNYFLLFIVSILLVTGCANNNQVELQGAGATFPYPLYSKMFHEYYKQFNTKINYQAIGSGGGIRQLANKTVDFGASDAFMSDAKLKKFDNKILHIPICLGAVALSYNLPDIGEIKLTPDTLAGIFLGQITKWNDQRLKAINPSITLPNLDIVAVYRSDGSGTTFIFTDYLAKVSAGWMSKVGYGKSVNWPIGLGGKGNAGVAGIVKQTPGAIGYIGHIYALQNKMKVVKLRNKSGNYVECSLQSVSYAADTVIPADTRVSITDTEAKYGYPISGFTWILAYQNQNFNSRTEAQARETKKLIYWMVTEGQQYAPGLQYAKLPPVVAKQAEKILDSIHYAGKVL